MFAALRLPRLWNLGNGGRVPGIEAFCMLLYYCGRPRSLKDIGKVFGRSKSMVSHILQLAFIFVHFRGKSILYWDQQRLTIPKIQDYVQAASEKVGAGGLANIFGYIDGTFIDTARPLENQEADYNGWKHSHGLKFQGVMAPDGIIMHLGGPYKATVHDAKMLRLSGLQDQLDRSIGRHREVCLYGDAAYGMRFPWVISSLRRNQLLNAQLRQRNIVMSSARIVVEWGFGLIKKYVF